MTANSLIQRAAQLAAQAHAGQTRRGSDTPPINLCDALNNIRDSHTTKQAPAPAAAQV